MPAGGALLDALAHGLTQVVHADARGVEREVGMLRDGLEQTPLDVDGLAQALAVAAERVAAAGLGKPPQQFLFVGDEVDEFAGNAERRSSSMSVGTVAISASVLRASRPTAVRR
jgi:hypothetical protein